MCELLLSVTELLPVIHISFNSSGADWYRSWQVYNGHSVLGRSLVVPRNILQYHTTRHTAVIYNNQRAERLIYIWVHQGVISWCNRPIKLCFKGESPKQNECQYITTCPSRWLDPELQLIRDGWRCGVFMELICSSWRSDRSALHPWKSSSLAPSQKVRNSDFWNPVHKKGGMIVPNPSSLNSLQFPESPWIPKESRIQISPASGILTESSLYTREEEGNDASYTITRCSPLRREQNMDHLDFCNVKFN